MTLNSELHLTSRSKYTMDDGHGELSIFPIWHESLLVDLRYPYVHDCGTQYQIPSTQWPVPSSQSIPSTKNPVPNSQFQVHSYQVISMPSYHYSCSVPSTSLILIPSTQCKLPSCKNHLFSSQFHYHTGTGIKLVLGTGLLELGNWYLLLGTVKR